jgi:hypothetical protein
LTLNPGPFTTETLPMTTATAPRPPAQLWGLWVVTQDRPEGFWWNHIHGCNAGGDTPMTFVSKEDAEATIAGEMLDTDEDTMVVALIGVAPVE